MTEEELRAEAEWMRRYIALCHACCPLGRRCQKCPAGVLMIASTPNDMGRMRCDSCHRIGRQRRLF